MSFEPDDRDVDGLRHIEREIRGRLRSDQVAKVECFSRDEAEWMRERLEARGIASDRFFVSWLEFPSS